MRICIACNHSFMSAQWRCPVCHWQPPVIQGFPALAPEFAMAGGGFKPEHFAELERLEAGSFWFRSRNRLILWSLQHYFPNAGSFMEIGCGTGFVLKGVANANSKMRLVGSEIFSQGLHFAQERLPNVELIQMDARKIPYLEEFDAIGAFDVLEHIAEDQLVLNEIGKALKPHGGLLLTVPQHQFLWSAADEYAHHVRRYSSRDLREKVEGAGFAVLLMTSFVSFLLPLMLAARWAKRRASPEQASAELGLAPSLDAILEQVMCLERFLIRSGLRLPMGGSLLMIAKKK